MQAAGVDLRERTAFRALRTTPTADGGRRVTGVETDHGTIDTERVILTGGPTLRSVGRLAGVRIPAGAARHTVAVLEPDPAFDVERMPMVFDIGAGLYWRLEEGGLLFGWSNPDEVPGEARAIDWAFYDVMPRAAVCPGARRPATSGCGGSGRRPSTSPPTTCRSSGRPSMSTAGRSRASRSPRPAATA